MFDKLVWSKKALWYDVVLSILYAWSVFQAYVYDAQTKTSGILIYVIVYGGFTLLIRSPKGAAAMNILSAITLPWFFTVPVIQQAGSYFSFQPVIGIIGTVIIGFIQVSIAAVWITYGQKFLILRYQYTLSIIAAFIFSIGLTFVVSGFGTH